LILYVLILYVGTAALGCPSRKARPANVGRTLLSVDLDLDVASCFWIFQRRKAHRGRAALQRRVLAHGK
jgi:hypothetical protein